MFMTEIGISTSPVQGVYEEDIKIRSSHLLVRDKD